MSNLIWERWCSKIPFYPSHFLRPLEKAAIASLQSRKENVDISAHCSPLSPSLKFNKFSPYSTRVVLGWNGPISETKRITEQAQVRGNYIREPCTTLSCWSSGTELAGVECGCLSLWWQRWLECLPPRTDCRHSPSRTRKMGRERDRTRIRTDVPALWQLIFPPGRKIFRTGCLWLQNILATCLLCASELQQDIIRCNFS